MTLSLDRASRVFLLSPANCNGRRAQHLLSPTAESPLAARLRDPDGVPLGELFAFVSGLYFRGKLAYARRFAVPPVPGRPIVGSGVHIITPSAGLLHPDARITAEAVRAFSRAEIAVDNETYRRPLAESALAIHKAIGDCEVVLLGSIASPKYVDVLLGIFGRRLCFPAEFVGRGDMSRGGLLLRQVGTDVELDYVPVEGTIRTGTRPPKLPPLRAAKRLPDSSRARRTGRGTRGAATDGRT